jgi:hypothetical protein
MKWISLPSPYPEISVWGCWVGNWQYVLSYSRKEEHWAASVKPMGHSPTKTALGWEFKTREEAIEAIDQHYKEHLS